MRKPATGDRMLIIAAEVRAPIKLRDSAPTAGG